MIIYFFVFLVRVLNSLIFLKSDVKSRFKRGLNSLILTKSDVKSRSAGAGFEPAAYGFEDQKPIPPDFRMPGKNTY